MRKGDRLISVLGGPGDASTDSPLLDTRVRRGGEMMTLKIPYSQSVSRGYRLVRDPLALPDIRARLDAWLKRPEPAPGG